MIPQPLTVATDWGAAAFPCLSLLFGAIAGGFVLYWRALRRSIPPRLPTVVLVAAGGLIAAWCMPVLFSSDVYAYAAYGEMARIGLDPYALVPLGTGDPVIRAAQLQWITAFPICVYGPLFVALARFFVSTLAPLGPLAQLDAFRVLSSAALLFCVPLAYAAYDGDRAARRRAAVTIAVNPVTIWCAAEGHNDVLALAVVLAGIALLRLHRTAAGAAVMAVSALIKAPGAAALLAVAAVERRTRAAAIAGLAVVVALSLPLIRGGLAQVALHGTYAPQASLQAIAGPLGRAPAIAIATALAILIAGRGLALVRTGSREGWIWLGLAGWTMLPSPYPWYGIWLLAVAAIAPGSRAGMAAIALSLTSLLRYVPDAAGTPNAPLAVTVGVLASLPLLALCYTKRPV